MTRLSRKEFRAGRAHDAYEMADLHKRFDDLLADEPVMVACPKCGAWQEDLDGFDVMYCEVCRWCRHPSRDGDGKGNMVCGICGHVEPA